MTILVVGAAGHLVGLVLPELVKRGAGIRAMVHDDADLDTIRGHGAQEAIVADLTDRASLDRAMEGVDAVLHVQPAFMEGEAETGLRVVAAAQAARVRRIVFWSVIHPVLADLPNHAAKAPVEAAILESGMEYVFLHPTLFFHNFAAGWDKVVETGSYAEPWSAETRFSRVEARDVAEVAAMALTGDDLLWGTYQLCAEGWLNRHDVATLMGEVLGREVEVGTVDASGMGDEAAPMRPMLAHYDRVGLRGNALTLRAILCREPRTLRAYLEELAHVGAAAAGGEHAA